MSDPLVTRMRPYGQTVFSKMSALARQHDAVNLGQGFPDTDGPDEVLEAARRAITAGHNQYPPAQGVPTLRSAIADHQRERYGIDLDPGSQVLVTSGATEAIASALLALVERGDEVVTFEPYYDSYAAGISLAGGVQRSVPLTFPELGFDRERLAAAFSERTKVVLINTPHNPLGKVFTREELTVIADLAREHDAWVVSDEVYEHMTYDGAVHVPIATLPGMAERTLTIGSAGKAFSVTGWKVGWISGPEPLVTAVTTVKQYLTFTTASPLQHAVAEALRLGPGVLEEMAASLAARRDLLVEGLTAAGFEVAVPQGTYFVVADAAPLGVTDAVQWCLQLPEKVGVVGVPVSVFCSSPDETTASLVRFAFCKQEDKLREACRRLAAMG
ncbi:pyridoxal phosphate-dependent aminotransferase [Janibacter cremeus]|uniref:pyridoxal phosphate-dependent aminotransferase n=1 Tax=Janibacter cremeus TaxID=1285192 RepID=UPI0023FA298C|nr:pyridoxal phosphate-dependent aminotransferase [Janibacter cremeus]WEV78490.1 pyridoxal phosphate-dependent aminotransferase [Janibacter cremeus]